MAPNGGGTKSVGFAVLKAPPVFCECSLFNSNCGDWHRRSSCRSLRRAARLIVVTISGSCDVSGARDSATLRRDVLPTLE